jgi:hypothetical protein
MALAEAEGVRAGAECLAALAGCPPPPLLSLLHHSCPRGLVETPANPWRNEVLIVTCADARGAA